MLRFPDGMCYVGLSIDVDNRLRCHKSGRSGKCRRLKEWMDAYGWDAVTVTLLEEAWGCELCSRERYWIAKMQTRWPKGLNMTSGGEWPDPQAVCDSWKNPEVRANHRAGRKRAWADPGKRANIMAGRSASPKVQAAKDAKKQNSAEANAKRTTTWESQRERRLSGLTGKAREQKLARLNRDRERQRRYAAAKRGVPDPRASAQASSSTSVPGDYETDSEE